MAITNDIYGQQMNDGLENFLWKVSLPETPSYNINTDARYSVYLWFHNGVGQVIPNPFLDMIRFKRNWEFKNHAHLGIEPIGDGAKRAAPGEGVDLGDMCFDLTPFVQSIEMPQIGPTGNPDIQTLFGNMKTGHYSPYASDGGQQITLQIIDTQYSVLDAIFYPWMRMIGNAKWYDPLNSYTELRTTPYPIATLEISTPMRWYRPEPGGNAAELTNYSFEFIGARPSQYAPAEINAQGRTNLLRSLTIVCDLVLVNLEKDSTVHQAQEPKPNNYASYVTQPGRATPTVANKNPESTPDADPDTDRKGDIEREIPPAEEEKKYAEDQQNQTANDAAQQQQGNQPGSENSEEPMDSAPANDDDPPPSNESDPPPTDISDETPIDSDDTPPAGLAKRDNDPTSEEEVEATPQDYNKNIDSQNNPGKVLDSVVDTIEEHSQSIINNAREVITNPTTAVSTNIVDAIIDAFNNSASTNTSTIQSPSSVISAIQTAISSTGVTNIDKDDSDLIASITISSSNASTTKTSPTNISHSKTVGVINEKQGTTKDVSSYGKITTIKKSCSDVTKYLIRKYKDRAEAYLTLKHIEMAKAIPSNSLWFSLGATRGLWFTGIYLTPVHNALLKALHIDDDPIEEETNPFIFRFQYLTTNLGLEKYGVSIKNAILKDAIFDYKKEYKIERLLGPNKIIRNASVWEIIDNENNYTGLYWCKLWITDKQQNNESLITGGRIAICKLNYLGEVIHSTDDFDESFFDYSDNIYISKAEFEFNNATSDTIFSSNAPELQVKMSGAYESEFHPRSAITRCQRFAKTYQVSRYEADVEIKGNLWHLEQIPDQFLNDDGTWHFTPVGSEGIKIGSITYFLDKEVNGELYYNIINEDIEEIPDDPARHFIAEPISAWEAYKTYESANSIGFTKTKAISTESDIRSEDFDRTSTLYFKLGNSFSGHSFDLVPFHTVTRSTSNTDIFEAFVPSNLQYVLQYNQQKHRLDAMNIEYGKLHYILKKIKGKRDKARKVISKIEKYMLEKHEEIKEILILGSKLAALETAYDELAKAEVLEDANLESIRKKHDRTVESYSKTTYSELDKYISRAEQTHLSQMTVARAEKALSDIRQKLREIIIEHNQVKAELINEINKHRELFQKYINKCYIHEWKKYYILSTEKCIKNFEDLLTWEKDRKNMVEKLTALFDHQMNTIAGYTPEELAAADVDDLILFYDWLASLTSLTPIEQSDASALSYKLRTEVKIPQLSQKIQKLDSKLERLHKELKDYEQLIYDIDYTPDNASEESNYATNEKRTIVVDDSLIKACKIISGTFQSIIDSNDRVSNKEKTIVIDNDVIRASKIISGTFQDDINDIVHTPDNKKTITISDDLVRASKIISGTIERVIDPTDQVAEKEKTIVVDEDIIRANKSISGTLKDNVDHSSRVSDKKKTIVIDDNLIRACKTISKTLEQIREPKINEEHNEADLKKVLSSYRYTHPSFASYTEEELKNSLLFVLSSRFLTLENKEFYGKLTAARAKISELKTILEEYDKSCSNEKRLLEEASKKKEAIARELKNIEKAIKSIVSKGESATREQKQDIKFSLMKKLDLETALKNATETVSDISKHYSTVSKPKLTGYKHELAVAREDYDKLLDKLADEIEFNKKVQAIAASIP